VSLLGEKADDDLHAARRPRRVEEGVGMLLVGFPDLQLIT
jgi:hypothetical protein